MICLNNKKDYEKIKSLSFHGWNTDPWTRHNKSFEKKNRPNKHWNYEIVNLGYKYNMNDFLASVGLVQLKKLNSLNKKRANILKMYLDGIKNFKNIKPTFPYILTKSSYWLFSVKTKYRDELVDFLKSNGISTAVHFVPLPLHKLFKKYNRNVKNSLNIWKEIVSLPFFPDLRKKEINFILRCLKQFDERIK